MGRNLSLVIRRELANLDKDANTRRSAMKALEYYVKELDSMTIPIFLAQISETEETGSSSGECTMSLYEVLARVQGDKIVPMIANIMRSITKTLASSACSFSLQQACSKVVSTIARYGIDPTTPEEEKRHVILLLCNPLSESLMGCPESLTSGAALCLNALVDSDNWRFASDEMVNKVCQNVAVALEEKFNQTNSHMGLVMTLARHNARIIEPYARLLIQSGLQILNSEIVEGNSQKRISAIHMIINLIEFLDCWSILSELGVIIEEMEKCQSDQMAYVRGAAFEALQTAERISAEVESRLNKSPGSVTGSSLSKREHLRGNLWDDSDQTPSPTSDLPESCTLGSFLEYDSVIGSPFSTRQIPHNQSYEHRNVNRKLWSHENGGVDVSLNDSFLSELAGESDNSGTYRYVQPHEFGGFIERSHGTKQTRSATTSPLRRGSHVSEDLIFNTPRKLFYSSHHSNGVDSVSPKNHTRQRIQSLSSANVELSPTTPTDQKDYSSYDKVRGSAESVASTDDAALQIQILERFEGKKHHKKTATRLFLAISFLTLALLSPWLWINDQKESFFLVPT